MGRVAAQAQRLTEKEAAAAPKTLFPSGMENARAKKRYKGPERVIIAPLLAADIRKPTSQQAMGSIRSTAMIAAPRLSIEADSVRSSFAEYFTKSINPARQTDIPKPATAIYKRVSAISTTV